MGPPKKRGPAITDTEPHKEKSDETAFTWRPSETSTEYWNPNDLPALHAAIEASLDLERRLFRRLIQLQRLRIACKVFVDCVEGTGRAPKLDLFDEGSP